MVNNYEVRVLRRGRWVTVRWKDLKVGEVVKIEDGQGFPADLVLLASSEPQGMAYIETSSLDGETNLKIRQALSETADLVGTDQLNAFSADIECEPPNKQVTDWNGRIIVGDTQRPLGINQLLLRGAILKDTRWIFGVIVYTGHDAKLLKNAKTPPLKKSNIDCLTNQRIVFLFFILVVLALASAGGSEFYNHFFLYDAHYLPEQPGSHFAWNAVTFFILYNNLIPISLQVTLEFVRFFQASYISCDILMYDEESDTPANARTSNLNEELGQVKFLMTDKTGTLTRNVMKFKRCCIEGKTYGDDTFDAFKDDNLTEHLTNGPLSDRIREFLTIMAVCHTVVPEHTEDGEINYQASSPDEVALVRGAASQGFVFHTRTPQTITIRAGDEDETYEILNVLEFSSDRKRMGVVVKDEDGAIKLYIKGADNKIFERLSHGQDGLVEQTQQHLVEFAQKGYRTLCFGMANVDASFYEEWSKEFHEASIALENREELLSDAAEKIEKDLTLVGASAIEDKLQDFVPETIRTLMSADIRVWMLTGDQRETAINIAQSSALCTEHTQLLILDKDSYDDVFTKLQSFADTSRRYVDSEIEFALVINGSALHHAMDGEARSLFAELCWNCRAVICCRMTPMQKAEVVELVKDTVQSVVLAIGDGANDVPMIQAANVGVGITGREGLRAASASDYSIAQFHFLLRLLLLHGTWNYHRSVKVILYSFYKNICVYIIELWFAFFSGFSGQTIFEPWTIAMFNVIFTGWPPIILGLFDRPVSAKMIFQHPTIYHRLQAFAYSNYQFTLWIFISLWHSLLLFFLTYGFLQHEVIWENGRVGGWLILGNAAFTYVVATVCLKALLECDAWTWVMVLICLGSIVSWFVFLLIYSATWGWSIPVGADMSGMATMMMSSWTFWLGLIFIPITTLLTDIVVKG
ncbi:putative phospholipid-transporting ATPase IA [Aphelenchoides avenae]|nr:putative phospholipid-transporting ATPase IA [Aphelenchus avenae]